MKLTTVLIIKGVQQKILFLQLKKNIYGHKRAGRVWNQHSVQGILNIGFKQSDIDKYVFYQGDVIFFFDVDGG